VTYVLIFGADPITLESLPPVQAARTQAEVNAWWSHYRRAGKMLTGAQLMAPRTATTVRFGEGDPVIRDGPFSPEPEAVGGYGIIDVADLDEALGIALSWPAGGYVEIRPLLTPSGPAEVALDGRRTVEWSQDE
jgi:hypothetical protein